MKNMKTFEAVARENKSRGCYLFNLPSPNTFETVLLWVLGKMCSKWILYKRGTHEILAAKKHVRRVLCCERPFETFRMFSWYFLLGALATWLYIYIVIIVDYKWLQCIICGMKPNDPSQLSMANSSAQQACLSLQLPTICSKYHQVNSKLVLGTELPSQGFKSSTVW